ncbi:MAG: hypothetical protein KDI44_17675 [Thiothrix sp.]|nr:hypothetical protein [Thiothrix sp.]HPQ97311.1 hypothetical protein [Thiolinea sp.]
MKLFRLVPLQLVCLLALAMTGVASAGENDLHPFFVKGGPTAGGTVEPLPLDRPAAGNNGVVVTEDGREYPWTSVDEDSPLASSSSFTPVNKRDQVREHPLRLFDSLLGPRPAQPETAAAPAQPEPQGAATPAGTATAATTAPAATAAAPRVGGGLSGSDAFSNDRRGDKPVREYPINWF